MTERALTLRAVKTVDFMTAKFALLPFEFPEEVARAQSIHAADDPVLGRR
jgi:GMP synthase PP-ATPase subunit